MGWAPGPAVDTDVTYRLDAKDVIVEVGGAWDEFARRNGGPGLEVDRVVGRSLYEHVTGEVTRMFVWTMFDAARKLGIERTQPYRCDTPDLKRFMEMRIVPGPAGTILVRHRLVSTEPIIPHVRVRAAMPGTPLRQVVLRCSSCNQLRHQGVWVEPEHLAKDVSGGDLDVQVAYSICPSCREAARLAPTR